MVPGTATNTTDHFPMATELTQKIYEFLKGHCQDLFFDMLSVDIADVHRIAAFYNKTFWIIHNEVEEYFKPLKQTIAAVACLSPNLDRQSPLYSVLRKTYQSNYLEIYKQIFSP